MGAKTVLGGVIVAAVLCGGAGRVAAEKYEDPAKFESDPLMGAKRM